MAGICVKDLYKQFDEVVALNSVSLDIQDGEFVVLLGPSGCGKTTFLRSIAGITDPDAGSIHLGERDIVHVAPENRNIGMVFQSYALFPHMTVENNVAFGLKMRKVSRAELARRVKAALELVDLADYARRFPRQLSGGQQQRVALARAIVIEPELLLFDEPLSNLDAKLREQLREELHHLQRRLGITSVYVTHDQAEAMALADRIVVMNAGRIIETGTPVKLYRQPRYRFTAEFLGHTNVFSVETEGRRGWLAWGSEITLKQEAQGVVKVSVRPEDVKLEATAVDAHGVVETAVFMGSSITYRVMVGNLLIRAMASGNETDVIAEGQPVRVSVPRSAHVLIEEDEI
ncbi:ABC transporter, nucleotide binding/ATPase protein [Candidatus Vecturithrix granuli]|uniref:ABC transporter, nucleotide binding/ATPase protein n=1 Tax=Vecturithrix granuli TaxID=1499967 RepID=A0A081C4J5_VECG1|nr:ABC transporter, nucleotide binding/ATPase protein [Candidatus Vecturithrix granuli]